MNHNGELEVEDSKPRTSAEDMPLATELPVRSLEPDKQELTQNRPRIQIKVDEQSELDEDDNSEISSRASHDVPRNGFFSPHDAPIGPPTPKSSVPEENEDSPSENNGEEGSRAAESPDPQANGDNQATESVQDSGNNMPQAKRRSSAIGSMVFVATALESIGASKEAKRRKGLGDSTQKALNAIKQDEPISPEEIFEPLRLATETTNISLTTIALDCIGKLITYSYFSMPALPETPPEASDKPRAPLIERAIDTICDCFQDEATPPEVQLQIVKSLLAAVLNDKIVVHGAGLLKAIRQVYNIFLLSKSSPNQQVAQGTLTQMVGTVFERVKLRLSRKEARLNIGKLGSGRGTANGSQVDLNGNIVITEPPEHDVEGDGDGSSDGNSAFTSEQASTDTPEKLTLQSFENNKNFDDTRIGDNAPTMVTRAATDPKPIRTVSGQHSNGYGEQDTSVEEEEDEIFVKDAFLVFRSMCRLSTKVLSPEQSQDLRSQNMRSKLISLAIIRSLMNNNIDVFTSPLVTIRGSINNEPTSFGQAINQYLRLALSRNGASAVRQVFETSCEIFWLMLKDMRVMLKVCF